MNQPVQSRNCPLCDSLNWKIVASGQAEQIINASEYYDDSAYDRLGISPQPPFSLSKCQDCQFVYASQVPADSFLQRLYASSSCLEKSVATFARPSRAAFAFNSLSTLLTAIATKASDHEGLGKKIRILDVGCAYGVGSLGLARTHYPYEVVGVELSDLARTYIAREGMQAFRTLGDLNNAEPFDGILLNDILEHVADPLGFVSDLKKVSHNNTAIWVNVPNFIDWRLSTALEKINQGRMDAPKDVNPWEHLSYFSPQTLDKLMQKVGAKRHTDTLVNYPVSSHSFKDFITSVLRAVRDFWRMYKGKYPNEVTTSGIYFFKK